MKCPKCFSGDTKKVSVMDKKWHIGHQRCNRCEYQDHWGLFCEPPLDVYPQKSVIILTGFNDDEGK